MSGLLAVAGRNQHFERLYDLPERVIPREHLEAQEPTVEEASRELLRRAAVSHGIGTALDLRDYYRMRPELARRALEELVEWVQPAAEETGAAPYIVLPERNAAQRQIDRFEEGASLYDIYAEQVRRTRDVALEPSRG